MSKGDDLTPTYAEDLRSKLDETPDRALLTKVTAGRSPSIGNADSATIAAERSKELESVEDNFLIRKLGLSDGPSLDESIRAVIEKYGKSERNTYRAVVYYTLTKHSGTEGVNG